MIKLEYDRNSSGQIMWKETTDKLFDAVKFLVYGSSNIVSLCNIECEKTPLKQCCCFDNCDECELLHLLKKFGLNYTVVEQDN